MLWVTTLTLPVSQPRCRNGLSGYGCQLTSGIVKSKVTTAINNANTNNIPATAVVLEQWSDENTFYIFNDATYTPKTGSAAHAYTDFTFPTTGKWTDPKAMADNVHNNGMKLVLWQVPIQKWTSTPYTQKDNDEALYDCSELCCRQRQRRPIPDTSRTMVREQLVA